MNIKNLMIGDWVKVSHLNRIGKIYRIDCANGEKNAIIALLDGDFSYENIEPIPITPEILKKNEFVHHNGEYHRTVMKKLAGDGFETISIVYKIDRTLNRVLISTATDNVFMNCKYVHELQNILKILEIGINIEL